LQELGAAAHRVGALFAVVVAEGLSLDCCKLPVAPGRTSLRRGAIVRHPAVVRRLLLRILRDDRKIDAADSGATGGQDVRRRGPRRLRADAGDARTTHPPREGDFQHLHQPGAIRVDGHNLPFDMGRRGLREVAEQNTQKAHYAARRIADVGAYRIRFSAPFFNEFVVSCPKPSEVILSRLAAKKIIGGLPLSRFFPEMKNEILMCVTETTTKAEIDSLIEAL